MSKQKKTVAVLSVVIALIASFLLGCFIGCNVCSKVKKQKKQKPIKFSIIEKYFGKKLSKEEEESIKLFRNNTEVCLKYKLKDEESEILNKIENEVLDLAKENKEVSFKLGDLQVVKDNPKETKKVLKKLRKCVKESKKHMTKLDKKNMKKGIEKMEMKEVIKLYHGVR